MRCKAFSFDVVQDAAGARARCYASSPAATRGEVMQLRTLGIASLLRSTMKTQRTCRSGRRQRLPTVRCGDFPFVSTPPREPDPAVETLIIDESGRTEDVVAEVVPPRGPPRIWPWLLAPLLLVQRGLA